MKTFSKAARRLAIAFCSLTLMGCPKAGLDVKVYFLDANSGGLVRKQENEFIRFDEADGYRCMSPKDFDATVQFVRSCLERRP